MIEVTNRELKEILAVAQRPIKGGLPFDLSDALGERITIIKEALALLEPQETIIDSETGEDVTPDIDMTVDFIPFPKSALRASGIRFGQEWFTGAMRKMFDAES